jgi:2-polyprenyl-3-methyl-5-hydroxy-6-metoxy-1,4-benzoquinol methylase
MATDQAHYGAQVEDYFSSLPHWDFEKVSCIFCGPDADSFTLFRKNTMTVNRCQCGFVYSSTQPKQSALDKFYSKSQAMSTWSTLKESPLESRRQREKFSGAIDVLKDHYIKSVLDIGCGNGRFLHMVRQSIPDVEVLGVDQNDDALGVANILGIHTHNQSLSDFLEDDERKFEAITLWGVLEHVKNPFLTLRQVKKKLTGPGLIIVCVPNVESLVVRTLWSKCSTFCPQHLWYFSRKTLELAFETSGLKMLAVHTIEPESYPITKALNGFSPYEEVPDWAAVEYLDDGYIKNYNEMIIRKDLGYKMIAVGSL